MSILKSYCQDSLEERSRCQKGSRFE